MEEEKTQIQEPSQQAFSAPPEPVVSSSQQKSDFYQLKTLLSWNAPGRPFRMRGKQFKMTLLIIVILISIILFLIKEFMLIAVVWSLAFLAFALATVPPHIVHYKITSEGIMVEDQYFLWQELYDFYFKKREGMDVLHVTTKAYYPPELVIVLGDIDKDHITSILLQYLQYREYVGHTFMEKAAEWLEKNFPLENSNNKLT